MKIFGSRLAFLYYIPKRRDIATPLSSIQNCPWFVFISKSIQTSPPTKSPEPQLLCPGSPVFAIRPCLGDQFIHMPVRFGTTSSGSWRKLSSASLCHPSRWLFIPILCYHCLPHLELFGPVQCHFPCCCCFCCCCFFLVIILSVQFFLFFLGGVYLGIPLIYCSSILGSVWRQAECYK